tara:strand:- start:2968 stop:3510 length:543 start_codon:yes stop_codon:yes gene_type:complete
VIEGKKYNIIYADPPWSYKENWGNGAVHHHYDSMTAKSIAELSVQDIADDNCHLYLWYTNSFVREAHAVCDAWGFKYKQTLTWVKQYSNKDIEMGLGYYFRGATEHVLFAVKGKLPRLRKDLKNVIETEGSAVYEINSRKHSEKPQVFRDIIVQHSGDLPRIELFARHEKEGWDVWGNEV